MGRHRDPVIAGPEELLDIGDGNHERLLGLKADVSPDGSATSFTCCFTNGPAFRVHVPFEEIAPILNTIRQASNLMVTRSRFHPEGENQRVLELLRCAMRPADSFVVVDGSTGDRVFIHQFNDHAPIALRLSVADVEVLKARFYTALARALN